jgi:hypothetical protein
MKSFRPRDGSDDPPPSGGVRNREADFHGQKRSNKTHASTTDPEARLYREGPGVREHGAQRWRRKAGRFRTQWGCPKTDLPIMRSLSSSSLAFSADARSRPARRFPNRGPRLGREVTLLPSLRSKRHRVSLRQGRLSGDDSEFFTATGAKRSAHKASMFASRTMYVSSGQEMGPILCGELRPSTIEGGLSLDHGTSTCPRQSLYSGPSPGCQSHRPGGKWRSGRLFDPSRAAARAREPSRSARSIASVAKSSREAKCR